MIALFPCEGIRATNQRKEPKTMTTYKWTGTPVEPLAFSTQKQAKNKIAFVNQCVVRVDFLFSYAFCILQGGDLVMQDGSLLDVTTVATGERLLIGRNDPYQFGCDTEDMRVFCNALQDRSAD